MSKIKYPKSLAQHTPWAPFLLIILTAHAAIINDKQSNLHLTVEPLKIELPALTDLKSAFTTISLLPNNKVTGNGNLLGGQGNVLSGDLNKLLGNSNAIFG